MVISVSVGIMRLTQGELRILFAPSPQGGGPLICDNYGRITEAVTASSNYGRITEAVTASSNYGRITEVVVCP